MRVLHGPPGCVGKCWLHGHRALALQPVAIRTVGLCRWGCNRGVSVAGGGRGGGGGGAGGGHRPQPCGQAGPGLGAGIPRRCLLVPLCALQVGGKSKAKKSGRATFCEHGRRRCQCKDCGGVGICEHGKYRSRCKECGGKSFCEHGRERYYCKECGGGGICQHGRQRSKCKECGGTAFCEHGRHRHHCKDCGSKHFCEHGRRRYSCRECGGKGICEHQRRRNQCQECLSPKEPVSCLSPKEPVSCLPPKERPGHLLLELLTTHFSLRDAARHLQEALLAAQQAEGQGVQGPQPQPGPVRQSAAESSGPVQPPHRSGGPGSTQVPSVWTPDLSTLLTHPLPQSVSPSERAVAPDLSTLLTHPLPQSVSTSERAVAPDLSTAPGAHPGDGPSSAGP